VSCVSLSLPVERTPRRAQKKENLSLESKKQIMSGFFGKFRKSAASSDDDGLSPPSGGGDGTEPSSEMKAAGASAAAAASSSDTVPSNTTPAPAEIDDTKLDIRIEDEPHEDPERSDLENQVRNRDSMISALEKARLEKHQELSALERDLEQEKLNQMKEALVHKIESERIKRQTAHTEERLKALEKDMQDKAAIHEYANLIKGVAPKVGVDAQYVEKLQSQLQKAVSKMEATTAQMRELDGQSRKTVDGLTKDIAQLAEERCRTELELRKQMEVLEEQKKEMQIEYEKRIRDNLKTLQALRAKAAAQTTIEELEEELEESDKKLVELDRIHEKQTKTIEQLNKSLAAEATGGGGGGGISAGGM